MIRFDLHNHTFYSHGANSVTDMYKAALESGGDSAAEQQFPVAAVEVTNCERSGQKHEIERVNRRPRMHRRNSGRH